MKESSLSDGPAIMPVIVPVIILNWNGLQDTCDCVDHLLASEGVRFRVIVIDNGSDDPAELQTLKQRYEDHPAVEVRGNKTNLGFARGMNKALAQLLNEKKTDDRAQALKYVALLNNDAFVEPDWLAQLVECAEATGAGSVASLMQRFDQPDRLDNAGHVFLNTGEILARGSMAMASDYQASASVAGACAGACLLRLDMLEAIGLFDPFYFTGYEDAELGLRAMTAGWSQVYAPKARVRHKIGASLDKIRDLNYAVTLQVNIHYAYFKLMPTMVILINAPWIVLKTVVLLTLPILLGRWRLAKVQWLASARTLKNLPVIIQARRGRPRDGLPYRAILGKQEFFFPLYWQYFRRFIWAGQPTIFER